MHKLSLSSLEYRKMWITEMEEEMRKHPNLGNLYSEEEKKAKCLEGYFSEFYDDFFESKLVNLHPSETSACMLI